jgi:hypothetical protein
MAAIKVRSAYSNASPELVEGRSTPAQSVPLRSRSTQGAREFWPRLALLGVLLLAAALRWVQPGLVEFKYDEVNITRQALGLVSGGPLPILSGGTTLGIQRGPLDVYLLALPLAVLGKHVEAAVWGLAALGVIAVALTYVLGRRVGGPVVGLMAALFMAANPWLIAYDRKLWAHIQVVFSVLLLLLAWDVVVRRKRWAAFWFPVVAALQVLAHVLAVLQALSWLGAFLGAPRRWWRRETGFGIVAAAGLMIPYAWALANRWLAHGAAAAAFAPNISGSATSGLGALRGAWLQAFYLFTGAGTSSLAGLTARSSVVWRVTEFLAILIALLIGMGLVRTVLWARGGSRAPSARLLLAWTVGPVVALSLGVIPVAAQYWTVLLPLPALYLALGLHGGGTWLARRVLPRAVAAGVAAVACAVALCWVGSYGALVAAVDAGAGARAFGVPLARWQQVLTATREAAVDLGTQEVRVAVDGVDPGYDSEPAAVAMLIGSPPWARFVAPQEPAALLLSHDRPSLYLWAINDPGMEALLGKVGELIWQQPLGDGHAAARLYQLPPAGSADLGIPLVRLSPEPVFDAGMALTGYAFPELVHAGDEIEVTLLWRVLDPPSEVRQRDFTAFNHVVDASGERVAQVDGLALLSRDWWPGDVLVQRYKIAVPEPGTYDWRVGLYSRADGGRSQVAAGGDSVDLGPLIVQ